MVDYPKKVFIAEDNRVNARVLQALLTSLSIESRLAEDGAELLRILPDHECGLILMDISMPQVDGYEATMRIRDGEAGEHNRNLPIVAVTALPKEQSYRTCLDVGMDAYINKPVQKEELLQAIQEAVKRRR